MGQKQQRLASRRARLPRGNWRIGSGPVAITGVLNSWLLHSGCRISFLNPARNGEGTGL